VSSRASAASFIQFPLNRLAWFVVLTATAKLLVTAATIARRDMRRRYAYQLQLQVHLSGNKPHDRTAPSKEQMQQSTRKPLLSHAIPATPDLMHAKRFATLWLYYLDHPRSWPSKSIRYSRAKPLKDHQQLPLHQEHGVT
jgi:hypothetical protein